MAPQKEGKAYSIESPAKAVSKYVKENYDEIKVRVEKARKISSLHAEARGESEQVYRAGHRRDMEWDSAARGEAMRRIAGGVRRFTAPCVGISRR